MTTSTGELTVHSYQYPDNDYLFNNLLHRQLRETTSVEELRVWDAQVHHGNHSISTAELELQGAGPHKTQSDTACLIWSDTVLVTQVQFLYTEPYIRPAPSQRYMHRHTLYITSLYNYTAIYTHNCGASAKNLTI